MRKETKHNAILHKAQEPKAEKANAKRIQAQNIKENKPKGKAKPFPLCATPTWAKSQ